MTLGQFSLELWCWFSEIATGKRKWLAEKSPRKWGLIDSKADSRPKLAVLQGQGGWPPFRHRHHRLIKGVLSMRQEIGTNKAVPPFSGRFGVVLIWLARRWGSETLTSVLKAWEWAFAVIHKHQVRERMPSLTLSRTRRGDGTGRLLAVGGVGGKPGRAVWGSGREFPCLSSLLSSVLVSVGYQASFYAALCRTPVCQAVQGTGKELDGSVIASIY